MTQGILCILKNQKYWMDRLKDLNAEVDHDFPVGRVRDYSEYIFTYLYSNIIYIYFKMDFNQTLRSFNI